MIRPSLQSFASELEKNAFLAKVLRLLETPIPGTPKLLMKVRGKAELAAREATRREGLRNAINGNIYKGLKKLKVDKVYQKLEPMIGSTTAPAAERALYGDRQIHAIAQRPLHWLLGNAPIPYAATAHNALVAAAQKLTGVPAARAYKMPEQVITAAAKAHPEKMIEAIERTVAKAPAPQRSKLKSKLMSGLNLTGIAAVPAGAEMINEDRS